jgi:hypothetical protein
MYVRTAGISHSSPEMLLNSFSVLYYTGVLKLYVEALRLRLSKTKIYVEGKTLKKGSLLTYVR